MVIHYWDCGFIVLTGRERDVRGVRCVSDVLGVLAVFGVLGVRSLPTRQTPENTITITINQHT